LNVTVISAQQQNITSNPFLLSKEKEREMLQKMRQNQDKLTVPRRCVLSIRGCADAT
jgi:hypothetical protein